MFCLREDECFLKGVDLLWDCLEAKVEKPNAQNILELEKRQEIIEKLDVKNTNNMQI